MSCCLLHEFVTETLRLVQSPGWKQVLHGVATFFEISLRRQETRCVGGVPVWLEPVKQRFRPGAPCLQSYQNEPYFEWKVRQSFQFRQKNCHGPYRHTRICKRDRHRIKLLELSGSLLSIRHEATKGKDHHARGARARKEVVPLGPRCFRFPRSFFWSSAGPPG